MKKRIVLVGLAAAALFALSGCTNEEARFPEATNMPTAAPATATPELIPEDDFTLDGMDPLGEEGLGGEPQTPEPQPEPTQMAVMNSQYAGATPVVLNPIDMPSPTPRPEITFTYQTYTASNIGLTFDGPEGWSVDDTQDNTFILTEPIEEQKDNVTAFIQISAIPMGAEMSSSEVKEAVEEQVRAIGETNYAAWKVSSVEERTLMDGNGWYQDYRGELLDGTIVRGRVHAACINRTLYMIHLEHPGWYNTAYLTNHGKLRETMQIIR